MQGKLLLVLAGLMMSGMAFAQDDDHVKDPAIGIHFFFNDFKSAANIRAGSLSSTLVNKQFGKFRDMSPGVSISYLEGISSHVDFSATLAGSFLDYPIQGKTTNGSEAFLLEGGASLHAKMFTDEYLLVPFLSAGAGISKYKGYYGAYIPLGVGLQFNFFDDAFLLVNSQYRIKVSENTSYHFFHSIGIAGNIGIKRKKEMVAPQ